MDTQKQLTTPVVIMVFNRPTKTARAFDTIRKARPKKLLIIADGPRTAEESEKCREVRKIVETPDWPCEVLKNYSDVNLGPKIRISSGLDWVFSQVEEAIILEDDCLPDTSFFPFCQELLEKYRNEPRVMQICGFNFAARNPKLHRKESYYFSNIGLILGWATWRRAWQYYDVNISDWPEIKNSGLLKKVLKDEALVNHYNHLFDNYYAQKVNSWDSQWFLTRWIHNGLSVVPNNNLVQNIGFDAESTNIIDPNDARAKVPVTSVAFPLVHPAEIVADSQADAYVFKYALTINQLFRQKALWFLKKNLPVIHKLLKRYKEKKRSQ